MNARRNTTQSRPAGLLSRFSRITTSGQFVPEIDGLRFLAISSVVYHHVGDFFPRVTPPGYEFGGVGYGIARVLSVGYLGVPLFFILSGFILALPFASHRLHGTAPVKLSSYYARRLTRLEPPYVISMLFAFALFVWAGGWDARALFPHLLASLTYTHNILYNDASPLNRVAWSLEIEVQFYVLVPLLVSVFLLGPTRRRALLATLVLACAWATAEIFPKVPWTIAQNLQYFATGFLLADLYLDGHLTGRQPTLLWDAAAAASVVAIVALALVDRDSLAFHLVTPLGFLAVMIAAFRGRVLGAFCRNPVVTTVGGMCYSIYLWHPLMVVLTIRALRHVLPLTGVYAVDLLVVAAIATPLVLLPSAAFFAWIERPCMDRTWPQRLAAALRGLVTETRGGSARGPREPAL
ncbi:MAG: acyltransferase family protein [Candidatus Binatia bacterium]